MDKWRSQVPTVIVCLQSATRHYTGLQTHRFRYCKVPEYGFRHAPFLFLLEPKKMKMKERDE